MEIIRNLSKQSFPAGSGRITLKSSLGDYLHLLKSSDFKLLVLKCAGSYSRVFTVLTFILFRHRFIGLCWHLNHLKTSVFVPWARYSRKKHHLTLSLQLSLSLFNLCRSFVTNVGTITKYLLYCTFYSLSSIRHQLI